MSLLSIKKKGYLYKLPVNAGVIKKWNKRWFVLHSTTHDGVARLDYYEREEHETTELGKRSIPLRECMGLAPGVGNKAHPHVFEFQTPIGTHTLAAPSETEKNEWLEAMKEVIREDMMKRKKKRTPGPPILKQVVKDDGSTVTKKTRKGMVYDPSMSGTYRVTLEQNDTARRFNLTGSYNLEITPTGVALIAAHSGASIAEWPYKHIKSYGKTGGNFSLESGRGAETGEGTFLFITSCGKEVFGMIHRNIKRLKAEKEAATREGYGEVTRRPKKAGSGGASVAPKRMSGSYKVSDARPRPPTKRVTSDASGGTRGVYRRSRDLEQTDRTSKTEGNDYNTLPEGREWSSQYSEVKRPKKKAPSASLPPRHPTGGAYNIPPAPPSYADVASSTQPRDHPRASRDSAILENPLAGIEEDLPPISTGVSNPLVDYTTIDDLDEDDFDDHLLDALDQIDLNDEEPDVGEDLEDWVPSGPPAPVPATASQRQLRATSQKPQATRRMSQQEFDRMWDDICATLPDVN